MDKKYKNLIYLIVAILLVDISFVHSYSSFFIRQAENQYSTLKDIILSGVSEKNCDISILFNKKIGMVKSDSNGKWITNLGKLPEGKYAIEILADSSLTSQSVATLQISVSSPKNSISFVDNFSRLAAAFSNQHNLSGDLPDKLTMVPLSTPEALKGNWQLVK
ncbi:MAG: hypothetical protein NTY04_03850 [Candidatus Staskawiczbacteria bacterium]|nr:hypothetical protein [Candidatus Staskawiczbacteria bacterium]